MATTIRWTPTRQGLLARAGSRLARHAALAAATAATAATAARAATAALAALTLLLLTPAPAAAQGTSGRYPDRPIRMIIPWAPGGSTDSIGRALAARMTETLGQSVVIDNRPGASAQLGADLIAKAPTDGYTLGIIELPHVIAPALIRKIPFDVLRDFAPITRIGSAPMVFYTGTGPDAPKDFAGFMALTKQGRPVPIALSGNGSVGHLTTGALASREKLDFNNVPYKGAAPALTDLAAGTVVATVATQASGSALLAANKIRALAVTSEQRVASLPGVPTFKELGYPYLVLGQWWGLVAPATTPVEVLEKVRASALEAIGNAEVRQKLAAIGVDLQGSSRDELRAYMRTEHERWGAVARDIGLQPE